MQGLLENQELRYIITWFDYKRDAATVISRISSNKPPGVRGLIFPITFEGCCGPYFRGGGGVGL